MKPHLPGIFVALTALAVSGCTRSLAEAPLPEAGPAAATYKAGHGLKFSPVAAQIAGLKTGEVGPRDIAGVKGVPAVSAGAVLRTVKGDFVFVINGEWFLRTPVTLGAADGGFHEVKDGLYEGDRIVTQGVRALWLAELQAVNGGVGCADGH